jgi:hypothetical protein
MAKPRHEEQCDVIAQYENRLVFEMSNLKSKVLSAEDGEDFYQEQIVQDRVDLCMNILGHLHDLCIRDRKLLSLLIKCRSRSHYQKDLRV